MTRITPTHPGEVLKEDFMVEHGLSANKLAKFLGIPTNRVTQIVNGQRAVTADTALRLERLFGTSAEFWMNLQKRFELDVAADSSGAIIRKTIKPLAA